MHKRKKQISARKVVITSLFVDVSDVVVNLVVALLTGSVVIRAEFLQGAADLIASALLVVGIKQSRKKPDKMHQFGFGKELYFWTLLSAIVMFTLAASFSFYFGLERFLDPKPIENPFLVVVVLLFATSTNGYALSLALRRLVGKRSMTRIWNIFWQTPLVETKNTLIKDLMGTSSALVGLISITLYLITGNQIFDGIGAMLIGIIIAILASFLIYGLRDFVIGKSAPERVIKQIRKEVLSVPEVQDILDLRTMMIGSEKVLVNIEVHLIDDLTTDQIEELIDKIKKEVTDGEPLVEHIQVELESPN